MPDEGQTALGAPGNDLTKAWPDWQTAAAHGNLLSHLWAQRPGMNDLVPGYKADESGLLHVLDYASLPARFLTNALQGAVAGTADDIAKTWNAPPGSADRSMAAMKSLLDVGAGSSVVEAPAGALRTFGGVGAKTADLTALERAKTLELRRSSPEAIHAATSWYRDVDGEWKFEIPNDQGTLRVAPKLQFPAKVTQPDHVPGIQPAYKAPDGTDVGHTVPAVQPTVPGKPMKFTELGDIYDDPKLYAAYPDLAKTPVRHLADGPEGALYNPVSKTIYLGEHSDPADMQATLLHEIQHAVQMKEGFAWGSDPALHLPAGHREAAMKNNTEFSRLHTLAEQAGVPYESLWDSGLTNPTSAKPYFDKLDSVHGPSFSKDYQAALAEHLRLTGETKQAYRDYRRVAGEVEAENSAERWRTGMAGKGLPTETSGYRPEDQIVQRLMPDAADSTPAASFGGYKGANPVQRSQLYSALKMERMGLSPEEIHSQTQWYRDADGEWKFEIPNDQGQLRTTDSSIGRPERDAWRAGTAPHPGLEPMIKFEGSPQEYYGPMDHGMKVKDIYSDPKLFSAYPHLAEIPVRGLTFGRAQGIKGGLFEDGSIGLTSGTPEAMQGTLIHELQHAIQQHEGFALGGNPGQFLPEGFEAHAKAVGETLRNYENQMREKDLNPFAVRDPGSSSWAKDQHAQAKALLGPVGLDDYLQHAKRQEELAGMRSAAFKRYTGLAGEVEARNSQERWEQGLGGQGHPLATPGYPTGPQEVLFRGQKPKGLSFDLRPVDHDPFATQKKD